MVSLFGLKQSQSEGLESPSRNCCVTSGETSLPCLSVPRAFYAWQHFRSHFISVVNLNLEGLGIHIRFWGVLLSLSNGFALVWPIWTFFWDWSVQVGETRDGLESVIRWVSHQNLNFKHILRSHLLKTSWFRSSETTGKLRLRLAYMTTRLLF